MTRTRQDLQMLQALPLDLKISMTKARIRQWVNEFGEEGVYISFSGGKDSTVLLHLVREMYPRVPAVFCDTGLEYPEIRDFVKTFDNVTWLRPKMNFRQVIEKYGYPFISKEVSECVYGARKYLTAVIERESLDRPTDSLRMATGSTSSSEKESSVNFLIPLADARSMANPSGGGTTESIGRSEESENLRMGVRETHSDQEIWQAVQQCKIHGGGQQETSQISQGSELLTAALTKNSTKAIDNQRVQMLMGIYTRQNKTTKVIIPNQKDRSMFSCERYQFFLDAPFEISNMCCSVMKKAPFNKYSKETGRVPMTAQMASESRLRTQVWLKHGCNAFDAKKKMSNPMSFWTEQDVLLYIYENHIPIAPVYGEVVKEAEIEGQMDFADMGLFDQGMATFKTTGCERTGCMFCGYGCHREGSPSRFERMKETHPKQYDYIMRPWEQGGLNYKEVIDWINEHGNLDIRY